MSEEQHEAYLILPLSDVKEKVEYRSLLPLMTEEDYSKLKEDIQQRGIQIPLIVNSNKELLDGYTRLRIAKELQIQHIPCIIRSFANELEEKEFILTINAYRRHLNTAQKVEVAVKLLEIEKEKAKLRQRFKKRQHKRLFASDINISVLPPSEGGTSETYISKEEREGGRKEGKGEEEKKKEVNEKEEEGGEAIRIVAKKLGISHNLLRKGLVIKEKAEQDKEIAELWNEALQGQYNIKAVYNRVKEKEARDKIEPIVEEAKRRLEERFNNKNDTTANTITITSNSSDSNNKIKILYGDFREVTRDIPDNSIDLIFTDPPYDKDSIPLLRDLALLAVRVLKPTGFLAVMYGQNYMPEFFDAILSSSTSSSTPTLSYYWTIALHMPESREVFFEKNIEVCWKPIFIFQKEPCIKVERRFKDYISEPKPDKSVHEWKQDIGSAIHVIKSFSKEGDIILDPLAGTGTTIEACIALNRRVIAVEKDKGIYEFLMKRFT
ncbi:MAG: DNA methyltransferase [Candidatus Nitrosocaldus sp.]